MEKGVLAERKCWSQVYKELDGKYICSECGTVLKKFQKFSKINLVVLSIMAVVLFIASLSFLVFLIFFGRKPIPFTVFFNVLLGLIMSIFLFVSILKFNKRSKCSKCSSKMVFFINSSRGKELLKQYYPEQFKIVENL